MVEVAMEMIMINIHITVDAVVVNHVSCTIVGVSGEVEVGIENRNTQQSDKCHRNRKANSEKASYTDDFLFSLVSESFEHFIVHRHFPFVSCNFILQQRVPPLL